MRLPKIGYQEQRLAGRDGKETGKEIDTWQQLAKADQQSPSTLFTT